VEAYSSFLKALIAFSLKQNIIRFFFVVVHSSREFLLNISEMLEQDGAGK
jgi:hypothetical protein